MQPRAEPETRPMLARVVKAIRAIVGAPDYARYLAHVRTHHPNTKPLSHEEFVRERERRRYEGTGGRCC
jgi:uncharacterized short protein YbdD (DUF466 family)